MIVIPAIDLKNGKCVRLREGKMDEETIFSEDPISTAGSWFSQGAEILHIVDLDGAVEGKPCLLYTSPSPRDRTRSRMPSSA